MATVCEATANATSVSLSTSAIELFATQAAHDVARPEFFQADVAEFNQCFL